MQAAAIDLAYSTLLLFLFGTVAWVRRPDDRARCWFAGWLLVLASQVAFYAQFNTGGWRRLGSITAAVDLLAVAGVFFVVSAVVHTRGRGFAVTIGTGIAVPTVLCLTLASMQVRNSWILAAALLARQVGAVANLSAIRRIRPLFVAIVVLLSVCSTGLMLFFTLNGHPELIVPVILAEVYAVAAIDNWNRRAGNTIGMRVASIGFLAWGAVFPLVAAVMRLWPQIHPSSDWWNPAKTCAAVGMILIVFEEEAQSARALARDYGLIFNGNPNPLWIFDTETLRFLAVNEAAAALHGYTKEEFLQIRLPDILHPDMRENAIRETRMPQPAPNRASRHIRKDGTEFPMDITAHSVVFRGNRAGSFWVWTLRSGTTWSGSSNTIWITMR